MRANLPYDPVKDFAPITLVVNTMEVLVVRSDTPMKSATDLVALAKSRPDGIAMASTGVGSPPHLALELFKGSSGANVLHAPYRGAAPAVTDVVGGQVHVMFADLPVLMPQIRGGTLRPIGVGSKRRAVGAAGRPDARRAGHQGCLRRQLVRAVRAGQDAGAGDRKAQRRGECRAEGSRIGRN